MWWCAALQCGAEGSGEGSIQSSHKSSRLETRPSPLCGVTGSGDRLVGSQAFSSYEIECFKFKERVLKWDEEGREGEGGFLL
jgi:hypothetical protein